MRYKSLPTVVLAAFAMLPLLAHAEGGGHKFEVTNSTTPDAHETTVLDEQGNQATTSCAGTLEAKCSSQSSYTTVAAGATEVFSCGSSDNAMDYRAAGGFGDGSVTWSCTSNAFRDVVSITQVVTISGTLSVCDRDGLTAASECRYFCKDRAGNIGAC